MTRTRLLKLVVPLAAIVGFLVGAGIYRGHDGDSGDRQLGARTRERCRGLGILLRVEANQITTRCDADVRRCTPPLGHAFRDSPDSLAGAVLGSISASADDGLISLCAPGAVLTCGGSDVLCYARLATMAADELGAPP